MSNPSVSDFAGKIDGTGAKFDGAKLRLDLVPVQSLEALADIYTYGANKYAENNWLKGIKFSRIIGAVLRHIYAWMRGEDLDPESQRPHLAHAAWGLFALLYYTKTPGYESFDDRVFRGTGNAANPNSA